MSPKNSGEILRPFGPQNDGEKMLTIDDFIETGALLTGHFRLSSGLHSDRYLQCAKLLMWPDRAERAGRELAAKLSEFSPQAVVSPALGGIVIGHEVARALGVRAIFAERKEGSFALRRGFALGPAERVARGRGRLHDRRFNAGSLFGRPRSGGTAVAVGSLVDRGLPPDAFPVPARSLLSLPVPSWPEGECPLCAKGLPVESPGSRHRG